MVVCMSLNVTLRMKPLRCTPFAQPASPLYRSQARAASEATSLPAEERSLFALTGIGMWTKLRPGVRAFLDGVAEFFELWIHTNGNRSACFMIPNGRFSRQNVCV